MIMDILIEEATQDSRGVRYHRQIASWSLPDTTVPMEISFAALATPDTRKVAVYRITIVPNRVEA